MTEVTGDALPVPPNAGAGPGNPRENRARHAVEVVVAALWRRSPGTCEVLVSRRPDGVHLAGLWELPGGKIEPGESIREAIKRELVEEIGFSPPPGAFRLLAVVEHDYPDRTVRLHAMTAEVPPGAGPQPSGQARWIALDALSGLKWPPANAPITAALRERLRGEAGPLPPGRDAR